MPISLPGFRRFPVGRAIGVIGVSLLLGACSSLPSSGPSGVQIRKGAQIDQTISGIRVVELTDGDELPVEVPPPAVFAPSYDPPPTDLLGPGDVIDVNIYEAGVMLFGGSPGDAVGAARAGVTPTARIERMPLLRIDDRGNIRLPYAGTIRAAGLTVSQLESSIRAAMRGLSQDPQAIVTIREGITNSVIMGGEVARPGRLVLPTNRETLSEVIALAGGYRGDAKDIAVRVQRRDYEYQFRLSDVIGGEGQDMRIYPGDRVSILRQPRSFSIMGSAGRVDQLPFSSPRVSLAEAIATAGGANPNAGDPAAIFVFRYVTQPDGKEIPVVYHVNMMKTGSYFISQRFAMRDKDVLYVANARANQASKLVQIISQLFAPVVAVESVVRATGN